MRNSLQILEKIQKIDLEIGAAEEEERSYQREIEKAGGLLRALEEKKNSIAPEAERLKALMREAEERVRAAKEKIEKNEKRMSEVKNDKELKAVTKETNDAKKSQRQAQEELNGLNAKSASVADKLKECEEGVARLSSEIEGFRKEVEEKRGGWEETRTLRMKEREDVTSAISPGILKRYETIRGKRGGRALVTVKGEACQGCFMRIPPQVYIELRKGAGELISCPHCHRILYVEAQAEPEAV